jgi:hypothetical protein
MNGGSGFDSWQETRNLLFCSVETSSWAYPACQLVPGGGLFARGRKTGTGSSPLPSSVEVKDYFSYH